MVPWPKAMGSAVGTHDHVHPDQLDTAEQVGRVILR